jgi:para-nitrobenzyl esterase
MHPFERKRPALWRAALLLAALSLPACANFMASSQDLLVTIDTGQLRGARVDGVLAFRGIPYAAAPVGALRWRPPQPAPAWPGIRPATDYGPTCAQPRSAALWFELENPSEDCLTLNVWTPDTRPPEKLPVMVWIHGGGFSQGSGNLPQLNGTAIPKKGVLVVTINYRLAMFGFLAHRALASTGDPVGNYGLLDAVAALAWVQRNIGAFGGDPGRVTVFGESAGADALNCLMVMPAARGLFQQAISQSSSVGMAPAPRVDRRVGFNPPAEQVANAFIAKLALPATDDLAATLRALPTERLLAAMGERDRFTPVVDGLTLPDQPGLLFATGSQQKVPYITGGNSWEASLGRMIGGGFSPAIAAKLVPDADKARLYPGLGGERLDDAVFGDLVILSNSRYLANQMRQSGAPVHAYYLSYVAADRRGRQPGVAHADDIAFVMGTLDAGTDLARVTERDRAVSTLMTDYWVQFAKTGSPNGPGLPDWPAWEPALARVLEIGDEVLVRDGFLAERMEYHLERGQVLLNQSR